MAEIGDLSEIGGEITLEWKIKDFSSQSDKKDIFYHSPKFYFSNSSWNLKIHPNGETEHKTEGWIGLYLVKKSSDSPVTLNFTLGLKTFDGEKESNQNYESVFTDKNIGYGCRKLISRSILLDKKSKLLPSDMLTVTCTIKNSKPKDVIGSLFCRYQQLSDNLNKIYKDEKSTDCLFKMDGDDIPVHRMILEARSPVFAAMFRHDTKEKQTGEISVVNVKKNTMKYILEYMYSGDIENPTTENVLSLYAAAEKYDINYVKEICSEFITRNLSVEWVCDVIKFAELYQDEKVGRRVRDYFKKNVRQIIKTEKWKMFVKENHDVSIELLHSVVTTFVPE